MFFLQINSALHGFTTGRDYIHFFHFYHHIK